MKKLRILIVLPILILACQKPVEYKGSQIIGLASPINLGFETTEIVLEDFFIDADMISTIDAPEGITVSKSEKGILTLQGSISTPVDALTITALGEEYAILLKKSAKEEIELVFDAKGNDYQTVQLKGEMNNWNPGSTELEKEGDVWKTSMLINKGMYQYLFVVDGVETIDPSNPTSVSNGMGGRNSLLVVGESEAAKPTLYTSSFEGNKVTFNHEDASGLIVFWQNKMLEVTETDGGLQVTIPLEAGSLDRSYIRAWAYNDSEISNDVLIPLQNGNVVENTNQLTRHDFHTWNMYFVLIDRFKDGNEANTRLVDDPDIHPKANYYGGDFSGITQTIKSGYFEKIGVNTLWLSPITQNPETAYGLWDQGGPVTKFSGYHGYWPISSSKTDNRYGTEEEFRELLDVAHENGMNVILDYVANHVHELHPVYQNNPDWATDLYLPDGTMNTQLWDEQRLTTWFDTFMPSLDFSNPEVIETMTDSALYWVKEFDLDGFRHDATKHIQLEFWRTLTRKIKEEVTLETGKQVYQVGETYGSRELISSYINSGMLDSQFDFGMYDAAVNAFGQNTSFTGLRDQLQESFNYYGYHNLMGYISGNHDKARFITYTSGEVVWGEDAKLAGWTREIGDPQEFAYDKLSMLHAWNLTIPGIPVTYQGDEYGQPGANDPDNRRWMEFEEDELNAFELRNRTIYGILTDLRNSSLPLLYGDFKFHLTEDDILSYSRAYFNHQVVVVFNKSGRTQNVSVGLRDDFDYSALEATFGNEFEVNGTELSIQLPANSFEILTLE
ncbi:MAG: alpha-glucosidase C-terminal domain-containing protein [Balneolaceae bacterium]|nr:alpha-glucosidase C-terminal domain-containing protein [Balneolaceae bacterium]MBO6546616.1 alpha-glucosidase C-terminal domain-containing protein [Balneolaceae bacterium]MBO6648974.1 alpha-glucosidase C-terminal domain-containing protein [Balneolaceae bacterium]